jgi:hypothetical protein
VAVVLDEVLGTGDAADRPVKTYACHPSNEFSTNPPGTA